VSNALKYTKRGEGRVVLGCRRRTGNLSIQVWDTGVGIPEGQLEDIFEEYHQLGNSARDRSLRLGLGLGLSIVRRLGRLLDHPVKMRPQLGRVQSSLEVKQSRGGMPARAEDRARNIQGKHHHAVLAETILVVEDDSEVRDLLEVNLGAEGHQVVTANDSVEALDLLYRGALQAGLVNSDFNLPSGMVVSPANSARGFVVPCQSLF
jgi:two-component system, chemotaxis family, CheB/CheR fusion protein